MNAEAQDHLREMLEQRSEAIARHWQAAIAGTSFVSLGAGEVRKRLAVLTGELVAALLAEAPAPDRARAVGVALAELHFLSPDALGRTQEILARELVAGLPPDQVAALQPRLATLLGAVATGFFSRARDTILEEQEAIRRALLTERRRAEEALRASEARFRAIFFGAAVGIGVADMDGRLVESNPALQAMLGYDEEELRGRTFAEFMHPDDAMAGLPQFLELVAGQRDHYEAEYRFFRRDGQVVLGSLVTSLVRDAEGRPQFAIGMGEDITARKQAEATIRELNADLERRVAERTVQLAALNQELTGEVARRTQAEAEQAELLARERAAHSEAEAARRRLGFLAEASNVLTASLDYEATLESLARLALPYLASWSAVDMLGDDGSIRRVAAAHVNPAQLALVWELEGHHPHEADALSGVGPVLRTGQTEFLAEFPAALLRPDGYDERQRRIVVELRPQSRLTVPLMARGRILGAISFVLADVGRRYGPADLVLAEDLARRAAIAADNARLYRESRAASAAREEFLSVAAHELKTPITNVRGFTELALQQFRRSAGPDPQRLDRALRALDRESQRLSRLVSQLLDVSRIEAGQLALQRAPTDVARLVRDVASDAQLTTTQHQIVVLAPESVPALVDPLRLEQVIANLLANAIKYSPAGGAIDLEVAGPEAGEVVIAVRDRGVGIPSERRARLFERFYQARSGDRVAGMGLGLYISRQIVERHGGRIGIEAPPGGGTRVVVVLPVEPAGGREDEAL